MNKDKFYLNYAKENYGLSKELAIKYRKHVEDTLGCRVSALKNEFKTLVKRIRNNA